MLRMQAHLLIQILRKCTSRVKYKSHYEQSIGKHGSGLSFRELWSAV